MSSPYVEQILKKDVVEVYARAFQDMRRIDASRSAELSGSRSRGSLRRGQIAFENQLRYESAVAGILLFLNREKAHGALEELFYASQDKVDQARVMVRMLKFKDGADAFVSMETLDPTSREQLAEVYLSPISVVHLFRQYFFELDSFLGTPESHVRLSPGATVELIEVHTRRTTVEKTLETALETLTKAETTTTQQDEISEAVKEDNQQDVQFGASVTALYASVQATSSFD